METIDRLDSLLRRFAVRARQFHVGDIGRTQSYTPSAGQGFLHILRSGSVSLTDPDTGNRIEINAPTVMLFPHPTAHTFQTSSAVTTNLACAVLEFEGGDRHPLTAMLPALVSADIDDIPGMNDVLEILVSETSASRCGHRHVTDRLFEVVLIKLFRHLFDTTATATQAHTPGLLAGLSDPQISRALTSMHDDPGHGWTLESLAGRAHLSRSVFAARFRILVGIPPIDYLVNWRITVAQQLLLQEHSVTDIATLVGYSSTSFSRIFTQKVGRSPRAWRNNLLQAGTS